jgi:branched-chain amino acid transport system substrate-binding protein
VWWSPNHPFTSSLIPGLKAADLCARYTAAAKKQWTQPLGFKFALFEVAYDALTRAKSIDAKAIADAVRATNMQTIVGPVRWAGQPVKNVTVTPLVGGQWRKGAQYPYDLVIVNNKHSPQIPVAGKLEALPS